MLESKLLQVQFFSECFGVSAPVGILRSSISLEIITKMLQKKIFVLLKCVYFCFP